MIKAKIIMTLHSLNNKEHYKRKRFSFQLIQLRINLNAAIQNLFILNQMLVVVVSF